MPATKLYDMNAPPLLSPQSHNALNGQRNNFMSSTTTPVPQHHLRGQSSTSQGRLSSGMMPTPDPTVASCISDEDVARTLIALGDASNFSSHGRTSSSTMDDTFSGVADAASSTGATSDSDEYSEGEGPKHRKYLDEGDDDYEHETLIKTEFDETDGPPKTKKIKTKMHDGPSGTWSTPGLAMKSSKSGKVKTSTAKSSKSLNPQGQMKAPAVPSGKPRQASSSSSLNFQLGVDEEDLSTKPRCQRCRKSKKGCDRQRPCGRCKDAGIGIEGCVSEDEGNGRKGRYGRHMGVPVKKNSADEAVFMDDVMSGTPMMSVEPMVNGSPSKKRKR